VTATLGFFDRGQALPFPRERCPGCGHPCRLLWVFEARRWHWLCVGRQVCPGTPAGFWAPDPTGYQLALWAAA
jgi:hypothetical protein